jgi:hypothetical protein
MCLWMAFNWEMKELTIIHKSVVLEEQLKLSKNQIIIKYLFAKVECV